MNSYFSTFITGFDEVIKEQLLKRLKDINIILLTDGLIVYKTTSPTEEIKRLRFINNSFVLLRKFEHISENSVNQVVKTLIGDQNLANVFRQNFSNKKFKFRIRATVKNQFTAIDKNLLRTLEEKITRSTRNLLVDRSLPDIELLITLRSEGFGLAGVQFTSRPNYEKALVKGELYPELAYILCLISEPKKDDVFFDPFAGHGSIPAQRLHFPHKEIRAGEIDRDLQRKLEKKLGKKVIVYPVDALSLSTISDSSIDKIVTDPPWGIYEKDINIPLFYKLMLKQFHRVLKTDGVLVVLTAQKELIEDLVEKFKDQFKCERKFNTLVSGKKAGVYKIRKIA